MKKGRIIYVAGPIDADHVYRCWQSQKEDESYFGTRYLTQFYQVCSNQNYEPYVVAPQRKNGNQLTSDFNHIEYWNPILEERSGLLYHVGQVLLMLKIVLKAIQLNAFAVVVIPGRPYWFILSILSLFNIRVIPSIHCVLWPQFEDKSIAQKILYTLTSGFFRNRCDAILVASEAIANQVQQVSHSQSRPIYPFLPTYSRHLFASGHQDTNSKFCVLFAGRVEDNKGIFTLLDIAESFKTKGVHDITFDVCGAGAALDSFLEQIHARGLEDFIFCHGFCDKQTLMSYYRKSNVVIVPTTTSFIEGFNQVVCEAVLAGRPVITSEVCPSVATVEDASIVVEPNDIKGYQSAVWTLYQDRQLYQTKQQATLKLREQFFDPTNGWGEKFSDILSTLRAS